MDETAPVFCRLVRLGEVGGSRFCTCLHVSAAVQCVLGRGLLMSKHRLELGISMSDPPSITFLSMV